MTEHPDDHRALNSSEARNKVKDRTEAPLLDLTEQPTGQSFTDVGAMFDAMGVPPTGGIDTSPGALASAWADLPEALRCHPGVKRLYRIATARTPHG